MFRIRPAQQDQLTRNLVGAELAKGLGKLSKGASFNPNTGQVCVVGARAQRTYLALDAKGHVVKITTPLGRTTEFAFKEGRLARTLQPTGLATDFEYADGGLARGFQRSDGQRSEMRFDSRGNLTEFTDPAGSRLRMRYDSEGRVTNIVERDESEIIRQYDDRGHLIRVVDPLGRVTRLQYGGWNRPERIVYPNNRVESYEYTTTSTKQYVGGEPIAEFKTDAQGRFSGAEYVGGRMLAFDYDDQGKVVSATSEDGAATAKYDDQDRVVEDAQDDRVVKYTYDDDGQLASLTLPTGEVISYSYDLDGRLLAIRDWNGGVQQFGYSAGALPVARWLPSGLVERTGYDHAGNVSTIQVDTQQAVLWYQSYGRDSLDRIVARADSRHDERHYAYNARGRLVAVTKGSSGQHEEYYSYDAAGCRLQSRASVVDYDSLNRPKRDGFATFRHDALGNRATRTDAQGTTRYTFGRTNLLTRVELPDGQVVKYFYDAFNRRTRKVTPDSVTTYVWAGHQLVQEQIEDPSGKYTREYLYAPGSFTPLAMRFRGETFYYHTDSLGTPQLLTDAMGHVAWSARYDSFGTATIELERVPQPLRLPGQYWDAETGLHYNRARYYDPALGVYLSRDPDAQVAGPNQYAYVDGDPINRSDPLGLWEWPSAATVASVAGGLVVGIVVGVAVAAAVTALAPAIAGVALVGALTVATGAGIVAGGIAGGAAGGAIGAAMTGGCIPCAAKKGALIGGLGAIPFLAAEAVAAVGAAAIGVFAAAGGTAGAIGYGAEVAMGDRTYDSGDLLQAVVTGAALGALGKFIGGKLAGGEAEPTAAPEGEPVRAEAPVRDEPVPEFPPEEVEVRPPPEEPGAKLPPEEPEALSPEEEPAAKPAPDEPTPEPKPAEEGPAPEPKPAEEAAPKPAEEAAPKPAEDEAPQPRPDEDVLARHNDELNAQEDQFQKRLDAFDAFPGDSPNQRGAAQAKLTEVKGERALTDHMLEQEPDAEMVRGFERGGDQTGFDQVWVKRNPDGTVSEFIIGEGKGPGAKLGNPQKGPQMSEEWVDNTITELQRSSNPADQQLGQELRDAMASGHPPITGRVVQADGNGGSNMVPIDGTTTPRYNPPPPTAPPTDGAPATPGSDP
jgi:RHS repeat-associated protein